MAVFKRGRVWWYKFQLDGQTVARSAGSGSTKEQARALEREHKAQLRQAVSDARLGKKPRRTFNDALLHWLEGEAKSLKTHADILKKARQVVAFTDGRWLEEGPAIAAEIAADCAAKGLKPATAYQRIQIVRRVLNLSYQRGWIDQPLGLKVKSPTINNARHVYLQADQLFALAEAAADERIGERPPSCDVRRAAWEAVMLAGLCGLRRGELLSLKPAQIVRGALDMPPTKSSRAGMVPLPEVLLDVRLPLRITSDQLRLRFQLAREAIGMPHLHFHDLRHTYASLLAATGAQLTDIRDLMRHLTIASTTRYAHLVDAHTRETAARMHRVAVGG